MPTRTLKPCSYPGCITLVKAGRCDAHRQAEVSYHNLDAQALYNTRLWKRMRARQLARQPWCEVCLEQNIYTPATDVDHIEPHEGDRQKFFSGPLQSLCHVCHSRKTAQEVNDRNSRGDKKLLEWGANSGRGLPREKSSQYEESR